MAPGRKKSRAGRDAAAGPEVHPPATARLPIEPTALASEAELVNELDAILTHSLGSNLLPADRRHDGPSWRVDWPLTAIALPLLLVVAAIVFAWQRPHPQWWPPEPYLNLVLMQAWGLLFVWLATWIGWGKKEAILKLVAEQLAPELSAASRGRAVELLAGRRSVARQAVSVAAATLGWCALAGTAMAYDLGFLSGSAHEPWQVALFWTWLLSFALTFAMAIKLGFTATFYWDLVRGYCADDLDSHPLTPAEAPAIRLTLQIGSELLGFMVFTALYIATLVLWVKVLDHFLVVNLAVCLSASIGLGSVVYTQVHRRLASLIRQRRAATLREVEARLIPLYSMTARDQPDAAHFGALVDLHTQVAQRTSGLGPSEMVKLAGPLIPQLAALAAAAAQLL